MNSGIIFNTLTIIFFSYVVLISIRMLLENRPPYSFLAWLCVLVFMPYLGVILYFFFGINWKKSKKKIAASLPEDVINKQFSKLLSDQISILDSMQNKYNKHINLVKLAISGGFAPITTQNEIKIYSKGEDLFDDMIEDLKKAKDCIHMEYFIWRSDVLGERIKEVLIEKAKEGLDVRLIFDGAGCIGTISKKYRKELKKAGVNFLYFHDPFSLLWTRFVNYRNHRKIVVIDGKIGYTGGMNVGQEYIDGGKKFDTWRDTHMKIKGEACNLLQNVFVCDWYNAGGRDITHYGKCEEIVLGKDPLFPEPDTDKYLPMQIITSGPDSRWDSIHKIYSKMISEAEKEICIESPYFVPDDGFLHALENAALSEVNVNLMITGVPDKPIAWWVAQTYFETLLKAGVNIYLYKKGFLHSKFCVIDEEIVCAGTCNMDIRSFFLHYEINGLIYDREVAIKFKKMFKDDILFSHKVTIEEYTKRPILVRLRNSICRIISPVL